MISIPEKRYLYMEINPILWSALSNYLFYDKKLSKNKGSFYAIKSRFNFLCRGFANRPFNRQNFTQFIKEMHEAGYAPSHINNLIKIGKHVDKCFGANEIQDFSYFQEVSSPVSVLSTEEIEALANVYVDYAKNADEINERQRLLILFLATTGCRIGEALQLKTRDLINNPPHVIFRETKNGTNRAVPIDSSLYQELVRISVGKDLVFVSYRGLSMHEPQINLDLKRRSSILGITKPVYCHVFRHSYITTMLEQGVDALDVAVIVGHRDPKTTLRYKHSLLSHYAEIITIHPLLKRHMTLGILFKKVKDVISRMVDASVFSVITEEASNELKIIIRRAA